MYEEEPSQEEKEVVICHGEDKGPVLSLLFVGYLSCTDRKKIIECVVEYFSVC